MTTKRKQKKRKRELRNYHRLLVATPDDQLSPAGLIAKRFLITTEWCLLYGAAQ